MPDRESGVGAVALGLLAALPVLLAICGCQSVSHVGDRYYAKGRLPEAAAAFEVFLDSSPGDDEAAARTLYRLGLILGSPTSGAYDPERSLAVLERLINDYPGSAHARDAEILAGLQRQVVALQRESEAMHSRLEEVEAELGERLSHIRSLEERVSATDQELAQLRESIPPLEGEIRTLIRQLAAKERELEQLEQLKAIDLAEPPR